MTRSDSYQYHNIVSNNMTSSSNSRRKSKFKKCPQAPKRFKSAYIFFSTEMMQNIKAKQKGGEDEKQKITDISKKISIAWKKLKPEERAKWNNIAKKDKERFLEEKKNYKGPWQIQMDKKRDEPTVKPNRASISSLSESDDDQKYQMPHYPTEKNVTWKDISSHQKNAGISRNLDKISQAERDAAHNLVQLHLQSSKDSAMHLSRSKSNDSADTTISNQSQSSTNNNNNNLQHQPPFALNSNVISRPMTYFPASSHQPSLYPNNYHQGIRYHLNQSTSPSGLAANSNHTYNRKLSHHFKFTHF